ncbi:MAG: hypothetical protein D6744_08355 [Planctomycetota bacterium]|nr:MAG: hypothetical protein D6744_08355 [Planctomycetota bacterium]
MTTLRADITGRFITHVDRWTNDDVEREFRAAVQDSSLVADEAFMHNLMFLVRKRDLAELHDAVRETLDHRPLLPRAQVSAMKTLYALGDADDRRALDERVYALLKRDLVRTDPLAPSELLRCADRIGGPKTLDVLREFLQFARQRQQELESNDPDNHAAIANADQLRNRLENQVTRLETRLKLAALDDAKRAAEQAELYLSRAGQLGFWGYVELVKHPSPDAITAVRQYVHRDVGALLPARGLVADERNALLLELRLRGVCLLEAMGAELTEAESKMLNEHADLLTDRAEFFRPNHDWEDVLDRE